MPDFDNENTSLIVACAASRIYIYVCVCFENLKLNTYVAEYLDNKNIFRGLFSGAVILYLHTYT